MTELHVTKMKQFFFLKAEEKTLNFIQSDKHCRSIICSNFKVWFPVTKWFTVLQLSVVLLSGVYIICLVAHQGVRTLQLHPMANLAKYYKLLYNINIKYFWMTFKHSNAKHRSRKAVQEYYNPHLGIPQPDRSLVFICIQSALIWLTNFEKSRDHLSDPNTLGL